MLLMVDWASGKTCSDQYLLQANQTWWRRMPNRAVNTMGTPEAESNLNRMCEGVIGTAGWCLRRWCLHHSRISNAKRYCVNRCIRVSVFATEASGIDFHAKSDQLICCYSANTETGLHLALGYWDG